MEGVWVFTSALRWKTDFFGVSDTSLTLADASSVGMGEICQLTALGHIITFPTQFMNMFYYNPLTGFDKFVLLAFLLVHFLPVISGHGSHHLPLLGQRSFGASQSL